MELELLVLLASLSSWDKAGCTCLSTPARSLFQKKKKKNVLGPGWGPTSVYLLQSRLPVESSCLNEKGARLGVPVFITMALPPVVCGPTFVHLIHSMHPRLYLPHT